MSGFKSSAAPVVGRGGRGGTAGGGPRTTAIPVIGGGICCGEGAGESNGEAEDDGKADELEGTVVGGGGGGICTSEPDLVRAPLDDAPVEAELGDGGTMCEKQKLSGKVNEGGSRR